MSARKSTSGVLLPRGRRSTPRQVSALLNSDSSASPEEDLPPQWYKELQNNSTTARPSARFSHLQNESTLLSANSEPSSTPLQKSWWKNLDNTPYDQRIQAKLSVGRRSVLETSNLELSDASGEEGATKQRSTLRRSKRRSSQRDVFSQILKSSKDSASFEAIDKGKLNQNKQDVIDNDVTSSLSDNDDVSDKVRKLRFKKKRKIVPIIKSAISDSRSNESGLEIFKNVLDSSQSVDSVHHASTAENEGKSDEDNRVSRMSTSSRHIDSARKSDRDTLVDRDTAGSASTSDNDESIKKVRKLPFQKTSRTLVSDASIVQSKPQKSLPRIVDIVVDSSQTINTTHRESRVRKTQRSIGRNRFSELLDLSEHSTETEKTNQFTRSHSRGEDRTGTSSDNDANIEALMTPRSQKRTKTAAISKSLIRESKADDRIPQVSKNVLHASLPISIVMSQPTTGNQSSASDAETVKIVREPKLDHSKSGHSVNMISTSTVIDENDSEEEAVVKKQRVNLFHKQRKMQLKNSFTQLLEASDSSNITESGNRSKRIESRESPHSVTQRRSAIKKNYRTTTSPSLTTEVDENQPVKRQLRLSSHSEQETVKIMREPELDHPKSGQSVNMTPTSTAIDEEDSEEEAVVKKQRVNLFHKQRRMHLKKRFTQLLQASDSSNVSESGNRSKRIERGESPHSVTQRRSAIKKNNRTTTTPSLTTEMDDNEPVERPLRLSSHTKQTELVRKSVGIMEKDKSSSKSIRQSIASNVRDSQEEHGREKIDHTEISTRSSTKVHETRGSEKSIRRTRSLKRQSNSPLKQRSLNAPRIIEDQLISSLRNASRAGNNISVSKNLAVYSDAEEVAHGNSVRETDGAGMIDRSYRDEDVSDEDLGAQPQDVNSAIKSKTRIHSNTTTTDVDHNKTVSNIQRQSMSKTDGRRATEVSQKTIRKSHTPRNTESNANSVSQDLHNNESALSIAEVFSQDTNTEKLTQMRSARDEIRKQEVPLMTNTKIDSYFTKIGATKLNVAASNSLNPQKKSQRKKTTPEEIDKAYLVNGKVYKRPKLPRPKKWVTDRLYNFLWKRMEAKFHIRARVRSEKFIMDLSKVVKNVTRRKKYENYKDELNKLLQEMARLDIIKTRNDFNLFCQDYLPYDFRIKVIPMRLPGNISNIPFNPDKLHTPILKQ